MESENAKICETTVAPPDGNTLGVVGDAQSQLAKPQIDERDIITTKSGTKSKSRRRRRGKRRRWKPYYKLSAEEREKLEIYEEKRAERKRELRSRNGIPSAPYNTTQFLLNDRQRSANDNINVDKIVAHIRTHTRSGSYESIGPTSSGSANGSSTGSETDDDYCQLEQREFDEEYETAHTERLESMSKSDLIKDYLELEKEFEHIQRELVNKSKEIDELKQILEQKTTKFQQPVDTGQLI